MVNKRRRTVKRNATRRTIYGSGPIMDLHPYVIVAYENEKQKQKIITANQTTVGHIFSPDVASIFGLSTDSQINGYWALKTPDNKYFTISVPDGKNIFIRTEQKNSSKVTKFLRMKEINKNIIS